MRKGKGPKTIIVGAGKLAWHLGPALKNAGFRIIQVYSRTLSSSAAFGLHLDVPWTTDVNMLKEDAELVIFCITDKALEGLLTQILLNDVFMIHTAGSLPSNVFENWTSDFGVLYPLMTFTKTRSIDFRTVPVCIEANNQENEDRLKNIAEKISDNVSVVNFENRKILHMAAIFACNFTNHMYRFAYDILALQEFDFGILKPLIIETAKKVLEMSPHEAQTGPASRHDKNILTVHQLMLQDQPEWQKIYTFVSESIYQHFQSE
jgi:predicted short-subunit dehydrogenase-like oxidoreductase (DUF2520 family)